MKRCTLLLLFLMAAGSAAASSTGGPAANLLYANSLYGFLHPIPTQALTPYALSSTQVKSRRRRDGTVGVLGNLLVPGLGSAVIGDRLGVWDAIAYWGSLSIGLAAITIEALAHFDNPNPQINTTALNVTAGISFGFAGVFYLLDLISPIHYARHRSYSE